MKKIFLGALALSMVLYSVQANEDSTELEKIEQPAKKQTDVKKPKKQNIDDLINKAKLELRKKTRRLRYIHKQQVLTLDRMILNITTF